MRFAAESPWYFHRYGFEHILNSGMEHGKAIHIRKSALCVVCLSPLLPIVVHASFASISQGCGERDLERQ
jgi:hypothetical protein